MTNAAFNMTSAIAERRESYLGALVKAKLKEEIKGRGHSEPI